MKKLILVRHAKSDWSDMLLPDSKRPLNERGLRDAPFMASKLKENMPLIDKFISSPAKRAITTAKIFANEYGIEEEQIAQLVGIYDLGKDFIIKTLETMPDTFNSIALFGHNPDISMTATFFGGQQIGIIPTCAYVVIELDTNKWSKLKKAEGKVVEYNYPKKYFDDIMYGDD